MKASVINKIKTPNKLFGYNFVFLIMILGIFGVFIISTKPTSALTYSEDVPLEFTFNPSITVSLSSSDIVINDLIPGTSSDSNIVDVNVITNNVNGYNLSSTVGNSVDVSPSHNTTNLVHSNGNDIFTSLSTNDSIASLVDFSNNTWGYSYSVDNQSTWSNYSGLPLYTDSSRIATLSEKYNPSDDTVNFKIGAKSSTTQSAGTYTNKINFVAIAFPSPLTLAESYAYFNKQQVGNYYTMQDMEPRICAVATEGSELQVKDVRDGSVYGIAKINEDCWMAQNLRITGVISDEYSNFTGEDFNVSAGDLDKTITTTDYSTYDAARIHDFNDTEIGILYNYYAATAGTISGSDNVTEAVEDICPSGWRIPSRANFSEITGYTHKSLFKPIQSGCYSDGSDQHLGELVNPEYGFWWSSTSNVKTIRFNLQYYIGASLWINAYGRRSGLAVRCIANNS